MVGGGVATFEQQEKGWRRRRGSRRGSREATAFEPYSSHRKGSERDEHVHIEGATAQRVVRAPVEWVAEAELDGRRQKAVDEDVDAQTGRDLPVQAGRGAWQVLEDHREQEDGDREEERAEEHAAPAACFEAEGARRRRRARLLRLGLGAEAGGDDLGDDGGHVHAPAVVRDLGRLAHQRDGRRLDAAKP